jgi:hypothetical protein
MNVFEVTETAVHEVSSDEEMPNGQVHRLSTQDYLETLLQRKNIPRTSTKPAPANFQQIHSKAQAQNMSLGQSVKQNTTFKAPLPHSYLSNDFKSGKSNITTLIKPVETFQL